MEIREAAEEDLAEIEAVIREAFGADSPEHGDQVATIWREVVTGGLARLSLVAVDGSELIGHVGVSHAWLDARRALVDVLLLSPLSVLPQHQGRGVGTSLVTAAREAAAASTAPMLVLEGSPGYYGTRGFERASHHGLLAPSDRTPAAAFQVAVFDSREDWMTGRVVYPDVWWRHDAAGLRDPLLAELERAFADR